MEKKRSVGVKVVGIIMFIYAFWLLSGGILKTVPSFYISYIRFAPILIKKIFLFTGLPLVALLAGLIYLVSSIGILRFKNWGRLLAIYFTTLLLLPCIYIYYISSDN